MEKTVTGASRTDSFDPGKWMTSPFGETGEGFFQGRAIVTSVGVFTYKNDDGSTTRELRIPEEVFAYETLESMKGKPVVNDHPKEKVTPENAGKYQVGNIGTDPSSLYVAPDHRDTDGFHVAVTLTLTDADTIAEVKAGKTALSMGYTCDSEEAPPGSVWCGVAYDRIQRNIRYNHVAIVDRARAGDAARIRMDGGAVQIETGEGPKTSQEDIRMRKIRIDGAEYEGDDGLVGIYQATKKRADDTEATLEKLEKDIEKLKEELSKTEADKDSNKDRADKLDAEVKALKEQALDPKRLDEAVKARVSLLGAAIKAGIEVADGDSDVAIRRAVIAKVHPQAKLDGKDDTYINARFDAAVEELCREADGEDRKVVSDGVPASGDREDSASAYRRMVELQKTRSRGGAKE